MGYASISVKPAYGRKYRSLTEAKTHWDEGKDFIFLNPSSPWDGKPVNKHQVDENTVVFTRYGLNQEKQGQVQ